MLGDARLTLADVKAPADVIVLDAFSSDVVPVHLLTREAIDLYISKLAPGGALVFHISNRYLELASVVAAIAAERGLVTLVKRDQSRHDRGLQDAACRRDRLSRSLPADESDVASFLARRMGEAKGRSVAARLDRRFLQRARRHGTNGGSEIVPFTKPIRARELCRACAPLPAIAASASDIRDESPEVVAGQRFPCRTIAQIVAGSRP